MNTTAVRRTQKVRMPLLSVEQVRNFASADGLRSLMEWVRRLVALICAPFKALARIVQGRVGVAATGGDDVAPSSPPAAKGADDLALAAALGDSAASVALADQVDEEGDGIAVVVEGFPEDLAQIQHEISLHVTNLLKRSPAFFQHSPDDMGENQRCATLLGQDLARIRYGHTLCVKQMALLTERMAANNPRYYGMSSSAVSQYFQSMRGDLQYRSTFKEGSAEDQLFALLDSENNMRLAYYGHMGTAQTAVLALGGLSEKRAGQLVAHIVEADNSTEMALQQAESDSLLEVYIAGGKDVRLEFGAMGRSLFQAYKMKRPADALQDTLMVEQPAPIAKTEDIPAFLLAQQPEAVPATPDSEKKVKGEQSAAAATIAKMAIQGASISSGVVSGSGFGRVTALPEPDESDVDSDEPDTDGLIG